MGRELTHTQSLPERKPTLNLPSVANGEFAPLCGAAATSVAALKTPVARGEGRLVTISSGIPSWKKGLHLAEHLAPVGFHFLGMKADHRIKVARILLTQAMATV